MWSKPTTFLVAPPLSQKPVHYPRFLLLYSYVQSISVTLYFCFPKASLIIHLTATSPVHVITIQGSLCVPRLAYLQPAFHLIARVIFLKHDFSQVNLIEKDIRCFQLSYALPHPTLHSY